MSKKTTFVVDECLGRPIMLLLAERLRLKHQQSKHAHRFAFQSVSDFRKGPGVHDEIWVPRLEKQGCIILTSDRGRGGKGKGEKLPLLCRRHGITHVLLSVALHHSKSDAKVRAIEEVFEELLALADAPRGGGYWLGYERGRIKLVNRDLRMPKGKSKRPPPPTA